MNDNVTQTLLKSKLCINLTENQIAELLNDSASKLIEYDKNDIIFHEGDIPEKLFVLIQGKVSICKDTLSGKRILITNIVNPGDVFGEIYLFIEKKEYDMYSIATEKTSLLEIGKTMFDFQNGNSNDIKGILQYNMMKIFAAKAYFMNHKLKVLGSGSVREKIVRYLFEHQQGGCRIQGNLNREDMADYLNVTRPSLSRELGKMKEEGLLQIDGRSIIITNQKEFEEYL